MAQQFPERPRPHNRRGPLQLAFRNEANQVNGSLNLFLNFRRNRSAERIH
jgi:hypothetical protein